MGMKSSRGFGIAGILIVAVVSMGIGAAGWAVYSSNKSTDSTQQQAAPEAAKPTESSDKQYTVESIGVAFKAPADWQEFLDYAKGIALKSPDFTSAKNLSQISAGSSLVVTSGPVTSHTTLDSLATNATMGATDSTKTFLKVAGVEAVRVTHSSGENQNNHDAVYLIKGNRTYTIEQQFKKSTINPYPALMDNVLASFSFTD